MSIKSPANRPSSNLSSNFNFRVAVLCYRWNFDLRQYFKEVMGNGAVKETPSHNTFLQIVIWGLPAIQTIVALIAKLVDADELLGRNFMMKEISN